MTLLSIIGETKMTTNSSLDSELAQTQITGPPSERSLKRLLEENRRDRIGYTDCIGQNSQGIKDLRIKQNGQTGYQGCSASVGGSKPSCENVGNAMTIFRNKILYLCKYRPELD